MIVSISGSGCWSGRGAALERHHTLRHAVAWSYELLGEPEKALLERCSVFAGGFDLAQRLRRQRDSDDPTSRPWICSTLWCASRCWWPTGLRGGPGFRCWRRSASSPRSNSSPVARRPKSGPRTRAYFAGREADIMALWDSPRQRDAYDWFTLELANLRTAFRWAADQGDLDVAATIATYAGWLGARVQTYEPIAWAEELIEPARAVDHPRLAFLYAIASLCCMTGRIEAAVRLQRRRPDRSRQGRDALPYGIEGVLGAVYLAIGQPERLAELCRAQLARRRDTHVNHPGMAGCRPCGRPVPVRRRGLPRTA